ncbi:MAG TPA: ABC transporter permease [Terracidiphilus sp.]|nr:ABC transporter permease [Terracidiphilus sp.]
MNPLFQDLRYGLRQLRKSPAFTLTVVLTLALGIGANAAVFTLFDQVLLRLLPVRQPHELVRLQFTGNFSGSASSFGGDIDSYFSYPMYKDLRDQNQVFSGMFVADRTGVGISWRGQAEDKDAEIVSGNYFDVLGLKPALGRLLTPADDTAPGANPVLVLSYAYWKSRFAASPGVIGQSVLINGHAFTILGVAPPNFESAIGGYRPGVFIPVSMSDVAMPWTAPRHDFTNHQSIWLTIVARLKPGVTRQQAEASLQPIWHNLRAYELTLYPHHSESFKKGFLDNSHLKVLDDAQGFSPGRADLKTPLIILMSMAGLLVAMCAINVATLLLLRASNRVREMSMRYALGAKRSRILSQLFVEGGLLGAAGAAIGIILAPAVAEALVRLMTSSDPGSEPYSASIDTRVLLFTLAISLVVSLLFSIAPAVHFLRPNLAQALRQNSGTASRDSQRFRKLAVGVQIGLSVILLGGAGLFVRTLDNLRSQNVGFDTANLVEFSLDPSTSGYTEQRTSELVMSAVDAVRRIPGVTQASASTDPELTGDSEINGFTVQGYKEPEGENMDFEEPWITPGYFAALHQPVLAGREFTLGDAKGQPKVAIVNMAFAKKFYGSPRNAIGRLISSDRGTDAKFDTTIVGVVGDVHHQDLRTAIGPAVYRPYLQNPHPGGVEIYARSAQSSDVVEPGIRAAIHQLDPTLVVDGLRTMDAQVNLSASDNLALAYLAIGFSALAMLLAAVGLYGVLAYSTEQRTREIGVRLALGAQRWGVVGLIVREMALIAVIAVVVALPAVVALARLFRSQLYGVSTFDPLALLAAVGLTAIMLALAAALPAHRAATVEPIRALRTE